MAVVIFKGTKQSRLSPNYHGIPEHLHPRVYWSPRTCSNNTELHFHILRELEINSTTHHILLEDQYRSHFSKRNTALKALRKLVAVPVPAEWTAVFNVGDTHIHRTLRQQYRQHIDETMASLSPDRRMTAEEARNLLLEVRDGAIAAVSLTVEVCLSGASPCVASVS